MFGYVNVHKDELKIKEYNVYKAYYCGLCFAIKNHFGNIPRLTLNYDITFLAILLSALDSKKDSVKLKKCVVHPIKKRPVTEENDAISYCAFVNVLLSYFKIKDNLKDGFSLKAIFASLFMSPSARKVKKLYSEIFDDVSVKLDNLSKLENVCSGDVDKVADIFASLLGKLFSGYKGLTDADSRILYNVGYSLGRFIYIADAVDDFEEDKEKKRYNPFIYSENGLDRDEIKASLEYTLSELSLSYELLNIKKYKSILDNIIYMGLINSLDKVFLPKNERCVNNERPL